MTNNKNISRQDYQGLNVLKFICAFLVVQIHIPSAFQNQLAPICRIAVPCFFIITGFFYYDYIQEDNFAKMKKSIIKILKLIAVSNLIYFLYYIIGHCKLWYMIVDKFVSPDFYIQFFFVGDSLGIHLWYLNSLIQALLVVYLVTKYYKFNNLLWIVPIGLFLNLILGTYSTFCGLDFLSSSTHIVINRNFVTIALPMVLIGCLLRKNLAVIKGIKYNTIAIITLFLFFCSFIEFILLGEMGGNGNLNIVTIPLAVMAFILFSRIRVNNKWINIIAYLGKNHSSNIYILHLLCYEIFIAIINYKAIKPFVCIPYINDTNMVLFVFALTLIISMAIGRLPKISAFGKNVKNVRFSYMKKD